MTELLAEANATVVGEHDSGGATLRDGDLVVRISSTESQGRSLTLIQYDTRIFSAAGAALQRGPLVPNAPQEGERQVRIDTSDRSPLVHSLYTAELRFTGMGCSSAAHLFEMKRHAGRRAAELFAAPLLPELERASRLVSSSPAPQPE